MATININVGDIYVEQKSWGNTFYQVNKITPKTIVVVRMKKRMTEDLDNGYGQIGREVPYAVEDGFLKETMVTRMKEKSYGDGHYLWGAKKSAFLTRWDGKPVFYNSMD